MSFKPSDIFIGVVDFFSVILPGALITFFLAGHFEDSIFGEGRLFPALTTVTQKWIVFLFATYIAGNLVFVIASWLDSLVYKKMRKPFFAQNNDLLYKSATAIRKQYIPTDDLLLQLNRTSALTNKQLSQIMANDSREILNTYKWSQHFLMLKYPDTIWEIKKLEADSKFFRSLAVAFLCISIFLFTTLKITPGLFCLLLCLLSLYRYGDLRHKSTQKAYELVITSTHLDRQAATETRIAADGREPVMRAVPVPVEHTALVDHLWPGAAGDAQFISVAFNDKWTVEGAASLSTLYCIEGKSLLILKDEAATRIALAKGALVTVPKGTDYEITNKQEEPLLLVSFPK